MYLNDDTVLTDESNEILEPKHEMHLNYLFLLADCLLGVLKYLKNVVKYSFKDMSDLDGINLNTNLFDAKGSLNRK